MGDRASYVVIAGSQCDVYSSHWGALSTPSVVISGPEETLTYIRALQPTNGLFDTTWAEGGILLDADTKTLIFWGGIHIASHPYLRRLLLPTLEVIWEGWRVSWATRGVVDFAEYPGVAKALGLDPVSVIDTEVSSIWNPYSEAEIRDPHALPYIETVVTVKWEDGTVADYTFYQYPHGCLTYGSALLDILRARAPDEAPREDGNGDRECIPNGGAFADVATHTLWVWEECTLDLPYLDVIKQTWPDWRVHAHLDGLAHQIALSGRDPALVTPPLSQVVGELMAELADDDDFDPAPFGKALLANLEGLDGTVQIAPGFFRMDRPQTSAAERRALLTRLFASVAPNLNDSDR